MDDDLTRLLSDLEEEKALEATRQRLEAGDDPLAILAAARKALDIVGRRFEKGEYFIPDLMYAGAIMGEVLALVKPGIEESGQPTSSAGKILIGTVAGDIHDIGKDIVVFLLEAHGFSVRDLGVDVPQATFVAETRSFDPHIIGLSGLLTTVFDTMKETVEALEAADLRQGRKIIIGGGQIDEVVKEYAGADAFATDAGVGVQQCLTWVRELER